MKFARSCENELVIYLGGYQSQSTRIGSRDDRYMEINDEVKIRLPGLHYIWTSGGSKDNARMKKWMVL